MQTVICRLNSVADMGKQIYRPCALNHGVECDSHNHCQSCGWNQTVSDSRIRKVYGVEPQHRNTEKEDDHGETD